MLTHRTTDPTALTQVLLEVLGTTAPLHDSELRYDLSGLLLLLHPLADHLRHLRTQGM